MSRRAVFIWGWLLVAGLNGGCALRATIHDDRFPAMAFLMLAIGCGWLSGLVAGTEAEADQ